MTTEEMNLEGTKRVAQSSTKKRKERIKQNRSSHRKKTQTNLKRMKGIPNEVH